MCRYDRVRAVQKTGESTRDNWHKTDWEKVAKDPKSIAFPREDWIHNFDAEKHAEEVFDQVLAKVTGQDATVDGESELLDANKVATAAPTAVAV